MSKRCAVGLVLFLGATRLAFGQPVMTPEEAGIVPLSGDILICGSHPGCDIAETNPEAPGVSNELLDGASARSDGCYPAHNNGSDEFILLYNKPPTIDPDLPEVPPPTTANQRRVAFIDTFDNQGTRLTQHRGAWVDDAGLPIESYNSPDGLGRPQSDHHIAAARSGSGHWGVADRHQPWGYFGPLAAWGSGELAFPGVTAVACWQLFDADGNQVNNIPKFFTDEEISDNGRLRTNSLAEIIPANGAGGSTKWAAAFWDRTNALDGMPPGSKWGEITDGLGTRDYSAAVGDQVGVVVFDETNTLLQKRLISFPNEVGGSQTQRGIAAGVDWFLIRHNEGGHNPNTEDRDGEEGVDVNNGVTYTAFDADGETVNQYGLGDLIYNSDLMVNHDEGGLAPVTAGEAAAIAGGRGDEEQMWGHEDIMYSWGETAGQVFLMRLDPVAGTLQKIIRADDDLPGPYSSARHGDADCRPQTDSRGNIFMTWSDNLNDGTTPLTPDFQHAVVRVFDSDMNPVTPSFHPFEFTRYGAYLDPDGDHTGEPTVGSRNKDNFIAAGDTTFMVNGNSGHRGQWFRADGWQSRTEQFARVFRSPFASARVPGDCNGDGSLDVSDASCVLGFLFLGAPAALPCGDGTSDDPANLALLDLDGDTAIDLTNVVYTLSFLFAGGPPPINGPECRPILGCAGEDQCDFSVAP